MTNTAMRRLAEAALIGLVALIMGTLDLGGGENIVAGVAVGVLVFAVLARAGRLAPVAAEPEAGWHTFLRELERARRHARQLALVRVTHEASASDAVADRARSMARVVDIVWSDADAIYLGLPEADRGAAELVVDRLRTLSELAAAESRIAIFPDEAVTAGALMGLAHGQGMQPVPLPRRLPLGAPTAFEVAVGGERRAGESGT
jgi:hypothetical protein